MNFVKQLTIKSMLRLLVCLSVLFLIAILITNSAERYTTLRQAASLKELAAIAGLSTEIAHEAQKERGMTAGFLGSKGQKFADRLPAQRGETDKRLAALKDFLAHSKADKADPALNEKLHAALAGIDKIATIRQQADGLAIAGPEAIAFYTGVIHDFLTTIPMIARTSPDQKIMKALTAYYNFVEAKERMGIERAVLSNTFANDSFAPGMYRKCVEILSTQKVFLENFLAFAEAPARDFYQEKMNAPAVGEVAAMETAALDKHQEGGFGIQAERWFDTITKKIELMKEVETQLGADLVAMADSRMQADRSALIITATIALVVITLSILMAAYLSSLIVGSLEQISDDLTNGAAEVHAAASQVSSVSQSLADGAGNQAAAIEGTVHKVQTGEKLVTSTNQSFQEVADSTAKIAMLMSEIATASREQASGVGQVNLAVTELDSVTQQNAATAEEAASASEELDAQAEQMKTTVQTLTALVRGTD